MRNSIRGFAFLALTALLLSGSALAMAAGSTPTPDPFAGVAIETLGSGLPTAAKGNTLVLLRITMQPGALIPVHHHPGQVILFVQSGTFGTTFGDGDAVITRAATQGTPVAGPAKSGVEEIMNEDDSVSYSAVTTHIMHNPGDKPLVLLVSALLTAGQPGFIFPTS